MITPYAYLGPCLKGTALELHRRYGATRLKLTTSILHPGDVGRDGNRASTSLLMAYAIEYNSTIVQ